MTNYNNRSNFLIRFFTHDVLRKLIALFFALLLYYTVSSRIGGVNKVANVPIEIEVPPGYVLLDDKMPTVTLTVQGSKNVVENLTSSNLRGRAKVLAGNYTPGNPYPLRLTPGNFNLGLKAAITLIEPSELLLNVEEIDTAKVAVEARFDSLDKLPSDYTVSGVKFNPGEVQISGPKSVVARIRALPTKPIPLDAGSTYSFDYNAELKIPIGVRVSPDKVVATVNIERSRTERTFASIPVSFFTGSGKAVKVEMLTSPNVEVKVSGPQGVMGEFKASRIHAFCDIANLKDSGSYTVDVGCYIDRGDEIRIVSVYPDKIKLKLTR